MSDNFTTPDPSSNDSPNNPGLNPSTLKARRRAIETSEQALAIVKSLEEAQRERNRKSSRITAKYNGERPYKRNALKQEGLAWKSNFSTKPLTSLVNSVASRFPRVVQAARHLTASRLPDGIEDATGKSEFFRREVTKTIRSWKGWRHFLQEVAQEDCLYGYTVAGWLDSDDWRPQHYRQDSAFLPDNTKQDAESVSCVALRREYQIHELFDLISDREAAEDAGWDIEATVEEINSATSKQPRVDGAGNSRDYEDLQRESSLALSLTTGAKLIPVFHLFVREHDGKVSRRVIAERSKKEIYAAEDEFESMSDVVSLFAFEHGNGKLHGSKGIGRDAYEMACALDRARNEVVDRLQLSGKMVFLGETKGIDRFKMHVVGNAVVVDSAFKPQTQRIDGNVEPFYTLDNYLTKILENMAGAVSPMQYDRERVTRDEVNINAQREEDVRDAITERFLEQTGEAISTIQKRLCSLDTTDEVALQLQARLAERLTEEEVQLLANSPATETVEDFSEAQNQRVVLFTQEKTGNPYYNQHELERRSTLARFDNEFADAVLMHENDPTMVAEQTRNAMLENTLLSQGQAVPVSPRDEHRTHVDSHKQFLTTFADDPNATEIVSSVLGHLKEHIQYGLQANPAAFEQDAMEVQAAEQELGNAPQATPPPTDEPIQQPPEMGPR